MSYYKYSFWLVPVLLIAAIAITLLGAGSSISAHAAKITLSDEKKSKIRKEEEHGLKKADKLYSRQAKALAQQYNTAAKLVAKQGGDPQPLLDAADYFKNQSKL